MLFTIMFPVFILSIVGVTVYAFLEKMTKQWVIVVLGAIAVYSLIYYVLTLAGYGSAAEKVAEKRKATWAKWTANRKAKKEAKKSAKKDAGKVMEGETGGVTLQ